jgi:hypothetical protein
MIDRKDTVSIPIATTSTINNEPLVTCYPNPFTESTAIEFHTFSTALVSLKVYNQEGAEIAVLLNRILPEGVHIEDFDGSSLPGGVYFFRLEAGDFSVTRKMVLIK